MKLQEFTRPPANSSKIDKVNKKVFDVALLQPQSNNGRLYSEAALNDATRLLEGAKVFVNHGMFGNRVQDFAGRVTNVYREGSVIRAKEFTILNESHSFILDIIEKDSTAFGFSIVAEGEMDRNNSRIVKKISKVYSVDVVTDPATNKGIFEETKTMELADITITMLKEQRKDLVDILTSDITAPLNKKIVELEEANKKISSDLAKVALSGAIDKLIADAKVDFSESSLKAIRSSITEEQAKMLVAAFTESSKPITRSNNTTRSANDSGKITDDDLLAVLCS